MVIESGVSTDRKGFEQWVINKPSRHLIQALGLRTCFSRALGGCAPCDLIPNINSGFPGTESRRPELARGASLGRDTDERLEDYFAGLGADRVRCICRFGSIRFRDLGFNEWLVRCDIQPERFGGDPLPRCERKHPA
jgi:hypothetical protein